MLFQELPRREDLDSLIGSDRSEGPVPGDNAIGAESHRAFDELVVIRILLSLTVRLVVLPQSARPSSFNQKYMILWCRMTALLRIDILP